MSSCSMDWSRSTPPPLQFSSASRALKRSEVGHSFPFLSFIALSLSGFRRLKILTSGRKIKCYADSAP
ncbi:hypothetical protein OPV22_029170 [Ensete ventricosum]|uniref:Uncharacterized protein n=1 Tax=Ensete ventricosum TaxID=4639 RepID=A0AAV8Q8G0_ENSVE|nr:hypothetical protein OPV22_029170 [Ensete ventricosum]